MNESIIRKLNKEKHLKKKRNAVVIMLCALVAFGTSYALINPATTMETQTFCGFEEHEHTDECFETVKVLDCPYEEGEIIKASGELPAEASPSDAAHVNTATVSDAIHVETATYSEASRAAYATPSEGTVSSEAAVSGKVTITRYDPEVLAALRGETVHHHTEKCYKEVPACSLPEHKHTLQCFSNPEADIEDASVWERDFEDVVLTGNWNRDVLAIAETQIGYVESKENYEVLEDGTTMRGYTRYGEWYGIPYGDWCAMFAAFCQHYAGVDSALMPADADCDLWIGKLKEKGLYSDAELYGPVPGDLVFFDRDGDSTAEHVGIVKELTYDINTKELTGFTAVEGNSGDCVCENTYEIEDTDIMGYGILPQNPEWFAKNTVTETGIEVTVEGINGSLPYPSEEITLVAKEIENGEGQALLAAQLSEAGIDYMDMILMDITLLHGEDEIEPEGPVYLSFAAPDIDTDSTVYHIDEENETVTEMSTAVNEIDSTASVETEHFSTFALTVPAKGGKNVTAEVRGTWNETDNRLENVKLYAKSTARNLFFNYDYYNGADWTIGAGTWSGQTAANTEAEIDISGRLETAPLSAKYRARAAQDKTAPENNNSGYSDEFSVYDILDSVKAGFTKWVSGPYTELFGGTRPTTLTELYAAFAIYNGLPSLTLEKQFENGELKVNAVITGSVPSAPSYVWEFYDDSKNADGTDKGWTVFAGETGSQLNAAAYSSLNESRPDDAPLLDGGKTVRCRLYEGTDADTRVLKAAASVDNVNPLQEVYDRAAAEINSGLHLSAYSWYLTNKNGTAAKTANVSIGSDNFNKYFYYDGVARNDRVPFSDAETYKNYLASEYIQAVKEAEAGGKSEQEAKAAALAHVSEIWDEYIFDLYNPNPEAGVVGNYTYYPKANPNVDPDRISTYGDKIIEWPKDGASSFHNQISEYKTISEKSDIVLPLDYGVLEDGVDYKNFIKGVGKTATADEPGDKNTNRSYSIDIKADTHAASLAPIAMLITVQTSWQMFDYPHANAVRNDGTYTTIEVGAAQHNTEMADLYDIKQAILRFVDYMDENYPGNNLVLGINEVQHGGSHNLIKQSVGGDTVYVSNDPDILRKSLYNWDIFGNCEHVHYDTGAMSDAAKALETNLQGWKDQGGQDDIDFSDINKVAVIIGGGTENTSGKDGYGCTLPWGTFLTSKINSVYALRANAGEPLNADGVLSWLDYSTNNSGPPYVYYDSTQTGGGTNFTAKYVTPNQDAVFNSLVRILQQEIGTKGITIPDPSKYIENVTLSDTVTDEFTIEKNKPFVASVTDSAGKKLYETVVTPETYDTDGKIASATAVFITYNSDGTEKNRDSVSCTVDNVSEAPKTVISLPVITPGYDGDPAHVTYRTFVPMHAYTQKLIICENTDKTTDVSFDFGTVYNTNSADLHFEVIARDDFIGSNNVYTNKGTADVSYHHTATHEGYENVDRTVKGIDTPEVNVPVRFDVNDGGHVTVEAKTPVHLEDLKTSTDDPAAYEPNAGQGNKKDSEFITETVHDLIDNYDQITGTVTYTWVIPGGKEYKVPVSLHVTDGKPDQDITKASEMAQEWIPKASGDFDVILKVTFTPDPVEDHGNFADDGGKTATRVTARTEEGHETVTVTGGAPVESGTKLTVSKVWAGEKGVTDNRPETGITFNLYHNGEFYDKKTVTEENNYTWTFEDLPYTDENGKIRYTVTEDRVPDYQTSYGEIKEIPHPGYWAEVPFDENGSIPLTEDGDPIEYLIVDKSTQKAVNADPDNKLVDVVIVADQGSFPTEIDSDDYPSYIEDNGYLGWNFVKDSSAPNDNNKNYIEAAAEDTELYIKKDGSYAENKGADTRLVSYTGGIIRLNDKYLKIRNDSLVKADQERDATSFTFYRYVPSNENPAYYTTVTNTYIPGGDPANETKIAVEKVWYPEVPADTEITVRLLQNGKEIDSYELDGTEGWHHTFEYLPGSTDPLPYFDPLTDEPYEYTVTEDVVSGYETGYKKSVIPDEGGGIHYLPYDQTTSQDAPSSYFEDAGYTGWYIKYTDGTAVSDNYVKSASDDHYYINKDAGYAGAQGDATVLKQLTGGKILIKDKFLKINNNGDLANEGDQNKATVFSFYKKVTRKGGVYWEEADRSSLDLTGGTEYMIVDKNSQKALKPVPAAKTCDVVIHKSTLYEGTGYVLTAKLDSGSTGDYMFSYDGAGIREEAEISNDPWTYGVLSGTGELENSVPDNYLWSVENVLVDGKEAFYLKVNGKYAGINDRNIQFTDSPVNEGKKSCCWQLDTENNNKLYVMTGNGHSVRKYLKVEALYGKGHVYKGLAFSFVDNVNDGTALGIFEQVSLPSGYDTYRYEISNISVNVPSPDGKVQYAKYIDYLDDNIEGTATKNPDTDLYGDYYRLYLDAFGTRGAGTADNPDPAYPSFTGVYITDHLSQYVTLADYGSGMELTVNKVNINNAQDITCLWYGNLDLKTLSIGKPNGDGASVIKSVQYTRAAASETETSTGMIRVDFQPDYKLEEGYKYIVSYNVELTDKAKEGILYDETGDEGTDYPGNETSSGKDGFRSNSAASVVYNQEDVLKIGIYKHPVVQVTPSGYELPSTGGRGPLICILSGLLTALSAAFLLGRKYQN